MRTKNNFTAKLVLLISVLVLSMSLCACGTPEVDSGNNESGVSAESDAGESYSYTHLEASEAAEMIESGECILVDTRGEPEYDLEHIPGAICVPEGSDDSLISEKLPDKDATILVYCDYGVLSKKMGEHLAADLGYTNVYEFDGLLVWEGETESNIEEE